jgi:hypothetical protein
MISLSCRVPPRSKMALLEFIHRLELEQQYVFYMYLNRYGLDD